MTPTRAILFATLVASAACAKAGPMAAGDPQRPEARKLPPRVIEEAGPLPDCKPLRPGDGPERKYAQRSIEEGANFAKVGLELLISAESPEMPTPEKQKRVEQAVAKFHTALAADPYNIRATYNLAAAYARVGRNQCALNLLARMGEMATFPSQRAQIQEHADSLFGRGKWKPRGPDPDFDRLRGNEEFRAIVKSF